MVDHDTDQPALGKVRLGLAITVSCAFFMENFDGSVLATALPAIARSLDTTVPAASIGITAYLVSLAIFVSLSGWLADHFGTRTIFLSSLVLFAVTSLACAFANSLLGFAIARVLQGAAGAMMVPVGRLIILKSSSRADLIRAMSIVTTPALLGTVLGPPVGGLLTTYLSWRAIFLINLPIAVAGIVMTWLYVEDMRGAPRKFDWVGFGLSGAGVALSMLGLHTLTHEDVEFTRSAALLVPGVLLLITALFHARGHPHPLIDLTLLRIPTFAAVVAGGGLFFISVGAMVYLLPLLFQIGLQFSPAMSGLVVLCSALGGLLVKRLAPRIMRRFGFRSVLTFNSLIMAIAMIGCALMSARAPIAATGIVLFGYGFLRSLQFSALNTMAYADVPPDQSSRATSLADTLKQLWQALGVSLAALVLHGLGLLLPDAPASVPFEWAIVGTAVLSACAALLFLRLARNAGAAVSGFASKHSARPREED